MSFLSSLRPTFSSLSSSPVSSLLHTTSITRTFTTSPASRLARITIVGSLADAPELVSTSTGQDVVRYALGTSHGPKDNRQTTWWKVACFKMQGPGRDLLLGCGKGDRIYVEGDCNMNKYQAKDGNMVSALSIVQSRFEIVYRKDRAEAEEQIEGQVESE